MRQSFYRGPSLGGTKLLFGKPEAYGPTHTRLSQPDQAFLPCPTAIEALKDETFPTDDFYIIFVELASLFV